jgi:uncharacterized membrane protein YhiD involved in acid resistance
MEGKLSFNEILEASSVSLTGGGSITFASIILAMVISLLMGVYIALIYRKAYQGVLFQKSFAMTIVLVTLVTTMVIMVISGNLVLSLGMVGALSIVRFRAAIKDPLDIVYVFWAVGVGIANGVAYFSVSIISSLFIGLSLVYFSKFPSRPRSKLLVINCDVSISSQITDMVSQASKKSTLRSHIAKDENCELVFEVMTYETDQIFEEIRLLKEVQQLRLLNYSANN